MHRSAIRRRLDAAGEAFNFSIESRSTVLDTVRLILRRMGSGLEPEIANSAQCEIREQYLSAEKARNALGWKAQYSFESGIDGTIAWCRSFYNASRR